MKQVLVLLLIIFSICNTTTAQDAGCKVLMAAVQGTYTGGCKKEKADGAGKSVGTDQYEGNFKNGYPDGEGTYTWKDGHYFVGLFKKGEKNGKGNMYYKSQNGADSIIIGFWKKDKYIGEYAEKYEVISKTSRVTKVDCYITNEKGDGLAITLHRLGGNSNDNSVPYVSSITPSRGTFYDKNTQVLSNTSVTRLQQVSFPFKAIFYLSNGDNVEILFNQKGDYEVSVDILY